VIRVVLADDHAVLREGIAALLATEPDLEVVGQAADADTAVSLCQSTRPDVAVIDLNMPGGGVRAIASIQRVCPETRTLALTMYDDPAYLRAVVGAGGAGYVVKGAASEELLLAIRQVAAGRSHLAVSLTTGDLRSVTRSGPASSLPYLSIREREVLAGVARGFTNREIAEQLGLRVKTVDTYRSRLQDKLGVTGRAALVTFALEAGLLRSDADGAPRPVRGGQRDPDSD
jgi:two-component system response regulator NreC